MESGPRASGRGIVFARYQGRFTAPSAGRE